MHIQSSNLVCRLLKAIPNAILQTSAYRHSHCQKHDNLERSWRRWWQPCGCAIAMIYTKCLIDHNLINIIFFRSQRVINNLSIHWNLVLCNMMLQNAMVVSIVFERLQVVLVNQTHSSRFHSPNVSMFRVLACILKTIYVPNLASRNYIATAREMNVSSDPIICLSTSHWGSKNVLLISTISRIGRAYSHAVILGWWQCVALPLPPTR